MTSSEVLNVISRIGVYEDARLRVHHFDGDTSGWCVNLKMPDGSTPSVYNGCAWAGSWCVGHFHPGIWCLYLRDFVLPKVLAEREAARLREVARRDQMHAKRFHPIDDAALFEQREGGAS